MKTRWRALIGLGLLGLWLGSISRYSVVAQAGPQGGPTTVYLPVIYRVPGGPAIGGCAVFPTDNPWNTDISNYPLHPNSANFINDISADGDLYLHADFGEFSGYGIPYVVVP